MTRFSKYAAAEARTRDDGWVAIDELLKAIETDKYGVPVRGQFAEAADASGVELNVVAKKFHSGEWVAETESGTRTTLRSRGWNWSYMALQAGWSQDTLLEHIDGGGIRKDIKKTPIPVTIDEEWAAWIHAMSSLLIKAAKLEAANEGSNATLGAEAALAKALYSRIKDKTIDAELRQILESSS